MPIPTPTYPAQRSKKTPSKPPVIAIGGGPRLIGQQAQPTTTGRPAAGGASHAAATPTMPPPGTYDPTIDAQVRAGARGVQDLTADNALADSRAYQDYGTSKEQADAGYTNTLADLLTNEQRGKADLRTQADRAYSDYTYNRGNLLTDYTNTTGRENEDYATAGANLARGYANLGRAQAGAAAAHGLVGSGVQTGALAAALQARAANQGRDQTALDTTHTRNLADALTARDRGLYSLDTGEQRAQADNVLASNRLSEDTATQTGRAEQQYGWTIGGLATDLQRGVDDRGISLGRAQREQNLFGQDAATEAMYQATTSGLYVPPAPAPKVKGPAKGKSSRSVTSGRGKVDPKRPNIATGRGRA